MWQVKHFAASERSRLRAVRFASHFCCYAQYFFGPPEPRLGQFVLQNWLLACGAVLDRAPRRGEVPVLDPKRPIRPGAPRETFENSAGRGCQNERLARARCSNRTAPQARTPKSIFQSIHFGALACARCDLSTSPTRNAHFGPSPGKKFECSARCASRFWPSGVENGLLASTACSIEHGAEARNPFWAQNGPNRPRRVEQKFCK